MMTQMLLQVMADRFGLAYPEDARTLRQFERAWRVIAEADPDDVAVWLGAGKLQFTAGGDARCKRIGARPAYNVRLSC